MMLSVNKNTKKVPRQYNIDVMYRILDALYDMGRSRLTDVVVHSGANHQMAKRYLYLMNLFKWAEIEKAEGHNVIYLTATGIFIHNQLEGIMQDEHSTS